MPEASAAAEEGVVDDAEYLNGHLVQLIASHVPEHPRVFCMVRPSASQCMSPAAVRTTQH